MGGAESVPAGTRAFRLPDGLAVEFIQARGNAVSAAVWIEGATIADAGIALAAVGLTTIHLARAEELLRGKPPSDELFAEAGAIASEDCSPMPDSRGPIDYKRHLAGVLTKRALQRATARALHQEA